MPKFKRDNLSDFQKCNVIKSDIFAHCALDRNNEDQDSCGQNSTKSSKNSGTEVIKEEVAQDWNPPLCHS